MSQTVTLDFNSADFRQHYGHDDVKPVPEPLQRHWMMDLPAGRDLLKAALRKREPSVAIPFFGNDKAFDAKLSEMVDVMGLRQMPEPPTVWGKACVSLKFVFAIARVQHG